MQSNAFEEVTRAMSRVNRATCRWSEATRSHSSLLAEMAREKADMLWTLAEDMFLFSEEIAREIPALTKNIGIIEANAPNFLAEIDPSSPFKKTVAVEFLEQLIKTIELSSAAIDGLTIFQQQLGGLKGISPEMAKARCALAHTLDDVQAMFSWRWFASREIAGDLRQKLNSESL